MTRSVSAALAIAGALLLSGCGIFAVTGSGFIVEQEHVLMGVSAVEAGSGFDVDIERGVTPSVVIRTDDNILPHVTVSTEGSRLVIAMEPGYAYFPTTLRAQVTLPELSGLDLSGGSVGFVASGFVAPATLRLRLSGGSRASIGTLDCEALDAELSGGSTMAGEINCGSGRARLVLSGGSGVGPLAGDCGSLTLEQSGGGRTDLAGFAALTGDITLSGGAVARVNVSSTLEADLSGGSTLEYRRYASAPSIVGLGVSGGSQIRGY